MSAVPSPAARLGKPDAFLTRRSRAAERRAARACWFVLVGQLRQPRPEASFPYELRFSIWPFCL
jgi:hypothetical protein